MCPNLALMLQQRLGAKPKHKDVFVQLNYSKATGPGDITCSALNGLVTAFRKAPVSNPDHRNGIKLHIDANKTCGDSKKFDLGGSKSFKIDKGEPGSGFAERREKRHAHSCCVRSFW